MDNKEPKEYSQLKWNQHYTIEDRNGNLIRGIEATAEQVSKARKDKSKKRNKPFFDILTRLGEFETKLNARYGWFFTNGNK